MIGPDFDGSRAVWMKSIETIPFNLHFLPPIDYEHLPQNAIWFDVGIIPFVNNEITVATYPLKLYEYFALGLPVVSYPVPDCMNYSDIVEIADNADSFGTAIDSALAMRSDSCFVSRLRECAAQNDWRSRAHSILRSICDADVE